MAGRSKKYCVVCCRPKKDHPKPFGKKCELPPLDSEIREAYIVEMRKVGEEPLAMDEVETEDELSQGEESDDDNVVLEALLQEKEQLLQQQVQAAKHIAMQEKALKEKQKLEKQNSIRKELADLKAALSLQQERIQYLTIAMDGTPEASKVTPGESTESPAAGKSTPGVNKATPSLVDGASAAAQQPLLDHGGARPKTRAAPVSPLTVPPVTMPAPLYSSVVQGLDPALAAYAQAAAAAAGAGAGARTPVVVQHAVPADPVPRGAAAAVGSNRRMEGKCLPEHYVLKPADRFRDESRVNYYDFVYGLLRFLYVQYIENGEPISDQLKYYVQIANLACQYKWSAVYDVHLATVNEMEINDKESWGDPISADIVHRYCNFNSNLPVDDRSGVFGDRRSRRDNPRRGSRRDDRDNSEGWTREVGRGGRSRRINMGENSDKVCTMYNVKQTGCHYGSDCKFQHICVDCYKLGEKAHHPALWCPREGGKPSCKDSK